MARDAFSLLHPTIQRELYRMRWSELRQIQVETIFAVKDGTEHLIISAETASGKTEAAFLPILSEIIGRREGGIGALYVGPLKALINDQFRRLEDLCEASEIPVFKWHGDVGSAQKKRFLSEPSGVLLITPESIESLFINHSSEVHLLFRSLPFIVIDEIHAFIGAERGMHLKSLIARIAQISAVRPRIIGLSATLGDLPTTQRWLSPGEPESVRIIAGQGGEKEISFLIKGYLFDTVSYDDGDDDPTLIKLSEDVIKHFYGKNSLIFINSRSKLELYTDQVKRSLEEARLPNLFRIHHGSLSRVEREETETALKSGRPTATFCSSTLELGIDVGDVSRIGQIGVPWSVHSLCQRLGRSGRREGTPSVMIMFVPESQKAEMDLVDRLSPSLLRALALSNLMLRRWCEPPETSLLHYSTLIQQILSVITERGGAGAVTLYNVLVERGAFSWVTQSEFTGILRSMSESDLIEQDPEGLLILGLKGERLVHRMDFYACFPTEPEMKVLWKSKQIGSIAPTYGIETLEYLILAGRRWEVLSVDLDRKEVLVQPSHGGKVPYFAGGGTVDIHPVVHQTVRDLLLSDTVPAYLDTPGKALLASARSVARSTGVAEFDLVPVPNGTYWFPWAGSAVLRTLMILGSCWGGFDVQERGIALFFHGASPDRVLNFYTDILATCPSKTEIAQKYGDLIREKYDSYVPEALLVKGFAERYIETRVVPPRTVAPSGECH
ncbi:DEAD/DEAH box helicase domain protein [Methanofollis liminatans DSM 4140]|uniref:DEAD/DEAH box helicase domain protein n=2 Tax=Methanofollis liminatans TaxID=2201 RepID=J0S084_9EURY|nr:DEAD/DEAH box helicase domain protein [Methanofollis liminatans DSM 4140]